MKNKIYKYSLIVTILSIIIPSVAFAAWWNPLTWHIFSWLVPKTEKNLSIKIIPVAVSTSTSSGSTTPITSIAPIVVQKRIPQKVSSSTSSILVVSTNATSTDIAKSNPVIFVTNPTPTVITTPAPLTTVCESNCSVATNTPTPTIATVTNSGDLSVNLISVIATSSISNSQCIPETIGYHSQIPNVYCAEIIATIAPHKEVINADVHWDVPAGYPLASGWPETYDPSITLPASDSTITLDIVVHLAGGKTSLHKFVLELTQIDKSYGYRFTSSIVQGQNGTISTTPPPATPVSTNGNMIMGPNPNAVWFYDLSHSDPTAPLVIAFTSAFGTTTLATTTTSDQMQKILGIGIAAVCIQNCTEIPIAVTSN